MTYARLFAVFTILIGSLFSYSANASADDTVVPTTTLNVRTGPGLNYNVIGTLQRGQVVTLVQCNDANSWCRITSDSISGWVSGRYIAPASRPVTDPPQGPGDQRPSITPRPGGAPDPTPTVCFYTETSYSGREVCAGIGDTYRTLREPWDNIIRSVRVTGLAEAVICTEQNFAGQCAVLGESVTDLGQLAGQVSSYRVVRP